MARRYDRNWLTAIIGMTAEMAQVSLSEAETINKSVGTWGVHEQWVYAGFTFTRKKPRS